MAEITLPFLMSFTDAVSTIYNERFATASSLYARFAMEVGSSTRENVYPRMSDIRDLREWVGDRVVQSLSGSAFAIPNKTYENTLEVKRDDFEDDQYGLYTPVVAEMGQQAGELPDLLSFGLLAAGENRTGYDGTAFFGGGHVTCTSGQVATAYNNLQQPTGADVAGPAWYLMCTTRPMKPLIVQRRRPFVLTPRMNLNDPTVFDRGTFLWGVDGRMNVGFGMWQLALKSYAPLTPAYYQLARAAMMAQHRADGTPFGITPNILVHPPSLTGAARTLLISEMVNNTSNPWKGTAEPVETTWLS